MRFVSSILVFIFLALAFASCKQTPDDEDIIIDPPDTTPPVDPFSAYTRIDSCYRIYPELCSFWYFDHFLVDSTFYVFSHDFKLVTFNMKGDLLSSKTIYSTVNEYDLFQIAFNQTDNLFYFIGKIENGTGFYTGNPLLLVFDLEGNLVHEDMSSWNNDNENYFYRIDFTPDNETVIVETDLEGSNGNYNWVHYLKLLNNSYQTDETHSLQIDSLYYFDFFHINSNSVIRIIAVIADKLWEGGMEVGHLSLVEMDLDGNTLNTNIIGDPVDGFWNLPFKPDVNNEPNSIYRWWGDKDNNSLYHLTINRYYDTGYPSYTRSIDLFKSAKYIGYNSELCDEFRNNGIIVYGLFQDFDGNSAPVNYGNYIIKIDNDGNEEYRILFDEKIKGFEDPLNNDRYPELTILEDDHYILIRPIYSLESSCYTLCFSDVRVP
jgi:hypothetical protein